MMFHRFYSMKMMNRSASASSVNAGTSCAHSADNTMMITVMDAMIMASIIIFCLSILLSLGLIGILVILGLVILVMTLPKRTGIVSP